MNKLRITWLPKRSNVSLPIQRRFSFSMKTSKSWINPLLISVVKLRIRILLNRWLAYLSYVALKPASKGSPIMQALIAMGINLKTEQHYLALPTNFETSSMDSQARINRKAVLSTNGGKLLQELVGLSQVNRS